MAKNQLPLPLNLVKKSNALARARWSAESVWEPRLIALLASKVHVDDTDFHVYKIPINELIESADKLPSGKTYREVTTVVDRLMSRVLTIYDDNRRGWTKYNVFSRCRYNAVNGTLELRFDPDLKPHYLNLQKNFVKYNLMEYLLLPSIYSQRLFEILKSWNDKPDVTILLSELHEMLGSAESQRKDFRQFRTRVIEKAHKDITQKTTFEYEWEPIKTGRKVTAIKFIFAKKRALPIVEKKREIELKKETEKSNKKFIEYLRCFNEHGSACEGGHNKKEICDMCISFR